MKFYNIKISIPRTNISYGGFGQYSDSVNTHLRCEKFGASDIFELISALKELFGDSIVSGGIKGEDGKLLAVFHEGGTSWELVSESKPRITEKRVANWHDLRSMCIRRSYYTQGTNEEYQALADKVFEHSKDMSNEVLYEIAKDILEHSDPLNVVGMAVTDMMFNVEREACRHVFEVE